MSTSGAVQCSRLETVVRSRWVPYASSERPTLVDCLRELGQLIQRVHGPTCVATEQKLQAEDENSESTKHPADEAADSLNATEVLT